MIGKVISPGAGVMIASQIEPVARALRSIRAGRERAFHVVEALGLDRARPQAGRVRRQREGDARRSARRRRSRPAPRASVTPASRRLPGDLEPDGALAGDHLRVRRRA